MMERLLNVSDVLKLYKDEAKALRVIEKNGAFFPVLKTPMLAGLVADLMADGHLQGEPHWRIDYTSKSLPELERFGDTVEAVFGMRGRARPCNTNAFGKTYNYGVNCKLLSKIMYLAGAPIGRKTSSNFSIPDWIYNDRKLFATFCRRLFSCEASVNAEDPVIKIEMWKDSKIMWDDKFLPGVKMGMEKHFGIVTTRIFTVKSENKHKDGTVTKPMRLLVRRRESILKFNKYIGFDDINKQNKLNQIVEREANVAET